ncbi:hypothetical protein ACO2Q3_08020 [Caulobacter sp. KR2-114]|uniref:hypothetical protein n=1 Tax=Caulobacter sp. KR2-114 TaxID=3400912 RepID=UPI003C0B9B46
MKLIVAGLAGLTLATAMGAAAWADSTTSPPSVSAPATVDSKIGDLLADPATKAVLDKDIPGLETSPYLDMVKGMSVRDIAKYPQAKIDDAKLQVIDTDLKAAKPAS